MTEQEIIDGLNLWLDAYERNPEEFEAEFRLVIKHLAERAAGDPPSYGSNGLALMKSLLGKDVPVAE